MKTASAKNVAAKVKNAAEVKNGVGRPPRNCNWPKNGAFTINMIESRMKNLGNVITKATLRNKLNKDVDNGILIKVEDRKSNQRGRPAFRYQIKPESPVKNGKNGKNAKNKKNVKAAH